MELLLTIRTKDIDSSLTVFKASQLRKREAARAVLIDHSGQVYLLGVSKHGYHKLPGGGIDAGEEITQALARELMEEVGCEADILAELGVIIELREYEENGLEQISYCFLARQIGNQQASALEEGEIEEGLLEVKAKSIDEAISLLEQDKPDNIEGKFIQKRDVYFLRAAKAAMHKGLYLS
ncbi:MAG: NUDIX domain-containing protein [Candidatus Saccharimonadales bacterium]